MNLRYQALTYFWSSITEFVNINPTPLKVDDISLTFMVIKVVHITVFLLDHCEFKNSSF